MEREGRGDEGRRGIRRGVERGGEERRGGHHQPSGYFFNILATVKE